MKQEQKIHTGFRLKQSNVQLIQEFEKQLGINKTSVVDMILTLVDKDRQHFIRLIEKSLH